MYPLNSVVHFSLNEMMNTLLFLTSILLSGERDSCLYCALGHQSRSQRSFSFSCCRYCSLSWPYTLLLESVKPAHRNPRSNEREEFTTWIGLAWRGPFWPWIWWVATASVTSRHPPKASRALLVLVAWQNWSVVTFSSVAVGWCSMPPRLGHLSELLSLFIATWDETYCDGLRPMNF